jgi:hypothetical protein
MPLPSMAEEHTYHPVIAEVLTRADGQLDRREPAKLMLAS